MSTITGVLVRLATEHIYVGTPDYEGYLKIDTRDRDTAKKLAGEWIDLHSQDADTLALSGHVSDSSQIPGASYRPGDLMAGDRIQSLTIATDGEKPATVTPELSDRLYERQDGLDRRIARLSTGFKAEWAAPTMAKQETGTGTDTTPPPFSLGQELYPSISPRWVCTRPWWCAHLEAVVEDPGEGPSHVEILRNGGVVATAVLAAGQHRRVVRVQEGWALRDTMNMRVTVAGAKAAKLTATPRGTMI